MTVELQILSGSRRGESLAFDLEELHLGDGADCHLPFDATVDHAARHQRAVVARDARGWHIRPVGANQMLVNQAPLRAMMPLRSGDVVRFSLAGPDVRFVIRETAATNGPVDGSQTAFADRSLSVPAEQTQHDTSPPVASPGVPSIRSMQWLQLRPYAAVTVALAFVVSVALVVVFQLRQPKNDVTASATDRPSFPEASDPPVEATPSPTEESTSTSVPPPGPPPLPASQTLPASRTPPALGSKSSIPSDPPATATDVAPPGIVLLAVVLDGDARPQQPVLETGGRRYAVFGTASVVGYRDQVMLLTTARLGYEMARHEVEVWAIEAAGTDQSEQAIVHVTGVFVHRHWDAVASERHPESAAHFNLALLTCDDAAGLSHIGRVAEGKDVQTVSKDSALTCRGIFSDRNLNDVPETISARLTGRARPLDEPVSLGLIQLSLPLAGDAEGSPVLDRRGSVVAVCSRRVRATSDSENRPEVRQVAVPITAEDVAALWEEGRPITWRSYGQRP